MSCFRRKRYDYNMQEESAEQQDDTKGWNDSLEVSDERPILSGGSDEPSPLPPPPPPTILPKFSGRIIAGIVIILGLIVGGFVVLFNYQAKPQPNVVINTQSLDNGTLNRLTSESGGGTAKAQLVITPPTTFKGDITVQGSASVQKNLTVGGSAVIQGEVKLGNNLTVAKSISVAGSGSFGGNLSVTGRITADSLSVGSLSISSVNLSGDVVFSGHIVPNGTAPAVRASVAAADGTATVSGNDTAGTVTITTGHGLANPGEIAIITFRTPFNTTPKVQLTPLNEASSKVNYYVTRSATFFTVDTGSALSADTQYAFDYLVTQ